MPARLLLCLLTAIAVAAAGMTDSACGAPVDPLPPTVRKALDSLRSAAAAKAGGGGKNEYTSAEDETILVQHVRNRMSLSKIILPRRSAQAAKNRWQVLKTLGKHVLDEMKCVQPTVESAHLDTVCSASTLDKDLLAALMAFRESELQRGSTSRWTLEQDIQLLQQ